MRISIVGPGRLGRSLAWLLGERGPAPTLVGPEEQVDPGAQVILLTVPDDLIPQVAATMPSGPVLLHCSGALGVEALRPHRPAGSLHPLMTFPGPEVGLPELEGVAAAVDGDPEAVAVAEELARLMGMRPLRIPGDRRLYHAAAVVAGNFATVLLAEAGAILKAAGVDRPEILIPLAMQSLHNAGNHPAAALTGPAARGDEHTVTSHLQALKAAGLKDVLAVYELMSRRAHALAHPDEPPPPPEPDEPLSPR